MRRQETQRLKRDGYEEVLRHSRYCFLKNESNLTDRQALKLEELLQYDLKSVRAYLLKESFQGFWQYSSPYWAERFLRLWCARAMRSKLEPMKKFVKTVRRHQPLMMNWFKAKKAFSSGIVEGLNRKINLVTRKAYGYRSYDVLKIALFHTLGDLPEPELTHSFAEDPQKQVVWVKETNVLSNTSGLLGEADLSFHPLLLEEKELLGFE